MDLCTHHQYSCLAWPGLPVFSRKTVPATGLDSLRGKTVFVRLSISFDSIFDQSFDVTTRRLEYQRSENLLKHSSAHKGENKHESVLSSHSDSQDRTN
ncbi:hypothetical protein BLNAU_21104 [Blattamonas nauphoetae]|uniref:Uncharacterized protein n=1 Tax=Blattamonas nauphoetae TaxID=2049346 RepID=A0ABQ9WWS5_9EUKA|nr:hypothetical protein BLNAU_21104 [Blattamonas nauphoetae]